MNDSLSVTPTSPYIDPISPNARMAKAYYLRGKNDIKKRLFRMGSNLLRSSTPVSMETWK